MQEQEKGHERHEEEKGAAAPMDPRVDHFRTDMDTKETNGTDANGVTNDTEGDNRDSKQRSFPWSSKEKLPSDEAGDKQDQTGVNAAAFGSDLKVHAGQLKIQSITEHGHACQNEQGMGSNSRRILQKGFNASHQKGWERH
jgi:hypothetical protein